MTLTSDSKSYKAAGKDNVQKSKSVMFMNQMCLEMNDENTNVFKFTLKILNLYHMCAII